MPRHTIQLPGQAWRAQCSGRVSCVLHSSNMVLLAHSPEEWVTIDAPLRGVLLGIQGALDVDTLVGPLAGGQPDLHRPRALPPPHKVSDVVSAPKQLHDDRSDPAATKDTTHTQIPKYILTARVWGGGGDSPRCCQPVPGRWHSPESSSRYLQAKPPVSSM